MTRTQDPFALTPPEIRRLLDPGLPLFPELEAARADAGALRGGPQWRSLLERAQPILASIDQIPVTRYTAYRRFASDGDRKEYEAPFFDKRAGLAIAALLAFFGEARYRDTVHDYIWSICEETNWVAPAHERCRIDLFAAETGFLLAETLHLLGDGVHHEVRHRVRQEVERRIFQPYLHHQYGHHESWYLGHSNWNGVCNSSVAATFLLLEPDPERAALGVAVALRGLKAFIDTAFEADGSSNEGVSYWHYGLINYTALAEMLRARSGGAIDLLGTERMRQIAAYPAKMQLSGPRFASFSDCDELLGFHPGILTRLAERTGERSLLGLVSEIGEPIGRPPWRLPMNLRNLLWWDGALPAPPQLEDAVLPASGVARLVGNARGGLHLVAAIKAGHNAENHNQNDIGSFIVHVDGENLLVDPGRGLYSRFYFGPQRYENIFANSYGHSVPRVGGQLQAPGREHAGELLGVARDGEWRRATVEMARAYDAPGLASLRRVLALGDGGALRLEDTFRFSGEPLPVEEALVTWGEVSVDGGMALVRGERHALRLAIEEPAGAAFALEALEEQSRANAKPGVLKRLSFTLPAAAEQRAVVRIEVAA